MDPVSLVTGAGALGGGVGLAIRIFGFLADMIQKNSEEKTKRDAILRGDIEKFAKVMESPSSIPMKEVDIENKLTWTVFGFVLFSREWKSRGKKALFTLRQHAISFTIYCWVSVIGFITLAFAWFPDKEIRAIPPSQFDRTVELVWGLIRIPLGAGEGMIISTGGIAWAIIATLIGIVSMLVVGVAGR